MLRRRLERAAAALLNACMRRDLVHIESTLISGNGFSFEVINARPGPEPDDAPVDGDATVALTTFNSHQYN